ncbi:Aldo/keto reductase [Saccharata proteae CBS 121410]|uniref:Aldo/keto reductase n=1 Tax=Saccharata proteae CBS 121410 TaxID=1314787 RepID=A0A9P4LT47_9PEZI|nr:Aldo/keto reductase [Saccharata proteae CBS 121410]
MEEILGKDVGSTGFGLMGLTWRAQPQPKEDSIKAMKAAYDAGAYFWNGGEFYGSPEYNSLHLVNEYFTKYPEHAENVVLSIKGGLKANELMPDGSPENVRRSVDECLRILDGKKKIDVFECARVDPDTPLETTIGTLAEYVKAGKIGGIGLSEVKADTIKRAAKVHPIASVEVEFSLYATDILTNGVTQTCTELDIPVVAYSPLGRGFLTGQIKTIDDIPEGDFRRHMPRFQPEVFDDNLKLAHEVEVLAKRKHATVGQIALAWVKAHNKREGRGHIIPIPGATTPERIQENMKEITLHKEDMTVLDGVLKKVEVKGGRYPEQQSKYTEG